MFRSLGAFVAISMLTAVASLNTAGAADNLQDVISAAVADAARPEADRNQDADRKPLEVLGFTGIKPGDKVADFIPGGGYATRLFAKVVGQQGHVYAVVPEELLKMRDTADAAVKAIAADSAYGNVEVVRVPTNAFKTPEPVDMVWTSMNYHDLHLNFLGPADPMAVNEAIFKSLKPGGLYIVLDHAAVPGSGRRDADTLHRIDPELVKKEVLAAGFELVDQSAALANPADDHSAKVFDAAIRGQTDKFIFKFRRP